nr:MULTISPECIES: restriction endonuclease subunit S [unclassified Bradyrhizobium]
MAERVQEAQQARIHAVNELTALHTKLLFSTFEAVANSSTAIGAEFVVTTGGTPSRANSSYWGGSNAWVSSGEVAFRDIIDTREKITDLGLKESNAKIYPPGTVLLAMIGQGKTRGQCAILQCAAATNQNVAAIHVTKTIHSPRYVYWWLHANYKTSRSTETGTAQPALSADRVKRMLIPLPERNRQDQIVSQLDALQSKLNAVRALQAESATELDAMLPAILDKAFKGEL